MKINKLLESKLFILTLVVLLNSLLVPFASAAGSLTALSDTLTRVGSAATSNHTIKFTTPTGITTGNTVTFTFPAGSFSMGSTLAGVTINGGAVTSANYAANVLTLTASASNIVGPGAIATVVIPTAQITNPTVGSPTTYVISIGGTFGDTGKIAVVIVPNDQVALTASIDPSMTFTLSANSTAFSTLSTASVTTASPNITLNIGTNANSGYTITVQDQGNGVAGGLYNAGASYNIASATTALSAGTEGYGLQATQTGGATIAAPYNVTGSNVGQLQRTPQNLATYASSTTSNHTITVSHLAAISASSKAGSYSDTVTYIATGNF